MHCMIYVYKPISCAGSTAVSLYEYGAHDFAVQTQGSRAKQSMFIMMNQLKCCSLRYINLASISMHDLHCSYHLHAQDAAKDLHVFNIVASD